MADASSFANIGRPSPKKPVHHDPLQDALRFYAGIAPGLGTAELGLVGGLLGGPAGATAGMGAGNALGSAFGGAANYGADTLSRGDEEKEQASVNKDQERFAREQAALQLLGGL